MTKKIISKLINRIFIFTGSLLAVISISIVSLFIYVLINQSIVVHDKYKIMSKAISWFYDRQITFEYIKADILNNSGIISLEINNLKIYKYNNYKYINTDNIKFNINFNSIIKDEYYLTNVQINKPIILYKSDENIKKTSLIIKLANNLLSKVSDFNIYDGKVTYLNLDKKYYISKINVNKKGLSDFNIVGSFLYKDNTLYKVDKKITFKSIKALNNYRVNLSFNKIVLPDFFLNMIDVDDQYSITGLFSGEVIFNIKNDKFVNAKLNILSDDAIIKIKENLFYKNLSIIKFPDISNLSLSIVYDFMTSYLKINDLTLNIKNNNAKNGKIILTTENFLNNSAYNMKYIFKNIFIKEYIKVNYDNYRFLLDNYLSGNGDLSVINSSLNNLKLMINNSTFQDVFFSNININFNKSQDAASIYFKSKGKLLSVYNIFKKVNILDDVYNELLYINNINAYNVLDFKIDFINITKSFNDSVIKVEGDIFSKNSEKMFINNIDFINNINYIINIVDRNITISGLANINDSDIDFSYSTIKGSGSNFNFNLNDQLFINYNLDQNFIGSAQVDCNIASQNSEKLYSCNIDLINSIVSFPKLNFIKHNNDQASLKINGVINTPFVYEDINFNYIDKQYLFNGYINFNKINNSYYINFKDFIYNKNDLNVDFTYQKNSLDINIFSGILNLTPFLSFSKKNKSNNTIISINAELNNLIIFDNILLGDTKLSSDNIYNNLSIQSIYNSDETILFNLNRINDNQFLSYSFNASNAGNFFELFNYNTEIKNGILSSQGFIGNLDNDNNLIGTLSIDNFKIMKAPLIAELLLAASFTGLIDVFNNEGIPFDQFDAQFTMKDNIINVIKSRAYGFSLGLTGNGIINNNDKSLIISGSIVPAYKLNTIFNDIPVIGDLLSGKEDEGLFAINYSAKGKWSEPDIIVNPLSILTPGIIRNIFD